MAAGVVPPEIPAFLGVRGVEAGAQLVGERTERPVVVRPVGDGIVDVERSGGFDGQARERRGQDVLARPERSDGVRQPLQIGGPELVG